MAFMDITNWAYEQIDYYTHTYLLKKEPTGFFKKHCLTRAILLATVPTYIVTSVVDLSIGVFAGFGALLTGGRYQPILDLAVIHLPSSKFIVALPYKHLLRAINLESKFPVFKKNRPSNQQPVVNYDGNGLISHFVINYLEDVAKNVITSKNPFKRHIVSRLTYGLLALSVVITRVVDGIIGVIAGTFAILTYGKIGVLNNLAIRGLQAPHLIYDLFDCTIKIINLKN